MEQGRVFLEGHPTIHLVLVVLIADIVFGVLRAFKEKTFNSAFGINGLIRKVGMILCVIFLYICDQILPINLVGFLPEEWLQWSGLKQVGLTEFFGVLFILYEVISILKNMVLIGIPIPKAIRGKIGKFLYTMTSEISDKGGEKNR